MEQSKDDTWKKILHIIITILTAIAASLTTQSCIKHKAVPTREPIPVVTLAGLPNQVTLASVPEATPTVLYTLSGFTQEEYNPAETAYRARAGVCHGTRHRP